MYIIFDSNASREYISKVEDRFIDNYVKSIVDKLKKNGVKVLVNPIVIMELLYHLADINDRKYSISYKAIKAIILTSMYQNKNEFIPMVSTPEILIAKDLFGLRVEGREKMYSDLMDLANYIINHPMRSIQKETQVDLNANKNWIDDVELEFNEQVRTIVSHAGKYYGTDTQKFFETDISKALMSSYIVRTTYNLLHQEKKIGKLEFNSINLFNPITRLYEISKFNKFMTGTSYIARRYPSFITLFGIVIKRIIDSKHEIKPEKLRNYIWDIYLMFNISNLTINKEKVSFVTSDKAIIKAALESDKDASVLTYNEFKGLYLD